MDIGYWIATVFATLLGVVGIRLEETPPYRVVESEGRYEVREYGPRLVIETRVEGPMQQASSEAFRRLAGYIFGANESRESVAMAAPVTMESRPAKVAMTAPVTMESAGPATVMRFVVPSKYTLETAPKPTDDRVALRELPGEILAVARYSGAGLVGEAPAQEKALREWLQARGYEPAGGIRVAGYDSPFALPFLRRNEVMLPVAKR